MAAYYEPGTYLCEVIEQGFTESKTGKPMICFKVKVFSKLSHGPEGEQVEDNCAENYDRTIRLVVDGSNDDMMDYAMRKLRHAGFNGESFADLNLVGQYVTCKCDASEYNGKPTEQWDLALPPLESKPLMPLDNAAARKLNTLFGKRLKDGAKKFVPVPQAENGRAIEDDEVPF